MVRQCDGFEAMLPRCFGKEGVSGFSRCHFDREFLGGGKFSNIHSANKKGRLQLFRSDADQAFIGVTASPSQGMIEVRHCELEFKLGLQIGEKSKEHG